MVFPGRPVGSGRSDLLPASLSALTGRGMRAGLASLSMLLARETWQTPVLFRRASHARGFSVSRSSITMSELPVYGLMMVEAKRASIGSLVISRKGSVMA